MRRGTHHQNESLQENDIFSLLAGSSLQLLSPVFLRNKLAGFSRLNRCGQRRRRLKNRSQKENKIRKRRERKKGRKEGRDRKEGRKEERKKGNQRREKEKRTRKREGNEVTNDLRETLGACVINMVH